MSTLESVSRKQAIFAALFSSATSSIATILFCEAAKNLPALLASVCSQILGVVLVYILLRTRGKVISLERLEGNHRDLYLLIFVRSFLIQILCAYALAQTSGAKAVFITKMEPYLLVLWAWVLGEALPSRKESVLLVIHIAGAVLLSTGGELRFDSSARGDLLLMAAVLASSLTYQAARRVSERIGALQTVLYTEACGAVLCLPLALAVSSTWSGPAPAWGLLALSSLLFYGFSMGLWYFSLRGIPGWLSSALRAIGPLIAAPCAWWWFGDRLNGVQICGAALILATTFYLSVGAARGKQG
jgi:drug/metabolite transporter (DMT)-like permease